MKTRDYLNQLHIKNEIHSRFNYNPDTGQLTWASRDEATKQNIYFNKHFAGKPAGCVAMRGNYRYTRILLELCGRRVSIMVSRICWLCMTGDWPKHTIDHIDRDGTNNKWDNLRDVTQSENNKNKGPYKKWKNCVSICSQTKKTRH